MYTKVIGYKLIGNDDLTLRLQFIDNGIVVREENFYVDFKGKYKKDKQKILFYLIRLAGSNYKGIINNKLFITALDQIKALKESKISNGIFSRMFHDPTKDKIKEINQNEEINYFIQGIMAKIEQESNKVKALSYLISELIDFIFHDGKYKSKTKREIIINNIKNGINKIKRIKEIYKNGLNKLNQRKQKILNLEFKRNKNSIANNFNLDDIEDNVSFKENIITDRRNKNEENNLFNTKNSKRNEKDYNDYFIRNNNSNTNKLEEDDLEDLLNSFYDE